MINFIKGELIGHKVKVVQCRDPSLAGNEGVIIDETKNTFLIKTHNKEKRIAKDIAHFDIDGKFVEGRRIKCHPWERIKKISE